MTSTRATVLLSSGATAFCSLNRARALLRLEQNGLGNGPGKDGLMAGSARVLAHGVFPLRSLDD